MKDKLLLVAGLAILGLMIFLITAPIYKVADEISKLRPQLEEMDKNLKIITKKVDKSFVL